MNLQIKNEFLQMWEQYFPNAELPVTFYFSEGTGEAGKGIAKPGRSCFICELAKVRAGKDLYFNDLSVTCGGGKRNLGYTNTFRPEFEYFLSCGNERVEGERYLKNPETVKKWLQNMPTIPVHHQNIVFKRWDRLLESDHPEVVIFFANPDILSGLFTLANFEQSEPDSIITPFSAGCGSIVQIPYLEKDKDKPKVVIGMFDPSARPCVSPDTLTFALPYKRFERMINCVDESFLITHAWEKVRKRLE